MSYPDYVQNTYTRVQSNGLPGTLADGNPTTINSFVAETEIPFGCVISLGSKFGPPNAAVLGGATVAATAGYHIGTAITAILSDFTAITNGSLTVVVDGTSEALTAMDFSACTDFAGVASVLTAKLTSAKGTFTFDADGQCFKLTSASTGASSKIGAISAGSGTSVMGLIGFATAGTTVDGTAQRNAVVLGVSVRSLSVEAKSLAESGTAVVKVGDVGAYLSAGTIKVLATEDAAGNGDVYYNTTTGAICATSGSGKAQLGSAKFCFPAKAGSVAVINVKGL